MMLITSNQQLFLTLPMCVVQEEVFAEMLQISNYDGVENMVMIAVSNLCDSHYGIYTPVPIK